MSSLGDAKMVTSDEVEEIDLGDEVEALLIAIERSGSSPPEVSTSGLSEQPSATKRDASKPGTYHLSEQLPASKRGGSKPGIYTLSEQ